MSKIKVVMVEANKTARIEEIDNSLESMQEIVGGYIECIWPFEEENVCCIGNEEGKIIGLPLNRGLRDDNGELYDIIAGTFFVCDATDVEFGSLSEDQLAYYKDMYLLPERFFRLNGSIVSCQFSPEKEA